MRRVVIPELLDTDSGTPEEVAESLRDLQWFNRWFGGISTSRKLIEGIAQATGRREFSLLEVAAGEGYVTTVHDNLPQPPRYPPGFSSVLVPFAAFGGSYTKICQHAPL